MKTIKVNSLPVLEVIRDLSKEFGTTYQADICEFKVIIPESFGSGFIKGYQLNGGIGVLEYQCTFYQDLEIKFIVSDVHPIKFIYVTKGNLEHRFENEKKIHLIDEYQNAIISSSDTNGHVLNFHANTTVSKFSIEVNRELFQIEPAFQNSKVNTSIYNLFSDYKAKQSFYHKGGYSLSISHIFKNLREFEINFSGDKLIYKFHMESVAFKTLVVHLSEYLEDINIYKSKKILRKREFEKIEKAIDFIDVNISTFKGIDQLTRETGLNSMKLQKGFKHLMGKTVNQYVQDTRLLKAKKLLVESDISISEIVLKIGLKSNGYFSRIFKEKYGFSPSLFKISNTNTSRDHENR